MRRDALPDALMAMGIVAHAPNHYLLERDAKPYTKG